jgi:hypothetical protein
MTTDGTASPFSRSPGHISTRAYIRRESGVVVAYESELFSPLDEMSSAPVRFRMSFARVISSEVVQ